jgi:hypothetical protein
MPRVFKVFDNLDSNNPVEAFAEQRAERTIQIDFPKLDLIVQSEVIRNAVTAAYSKSHMEQAK